MKEYIFNSHNGSITQVLQYKKTQNTKLGMNKLVLGTYHFSTQQIIHNDIHLDTDCCFGCPLSYNSGNGKCYTHKGHQLLGLKAMLERLNRIQDTIRPFNEEAFAKFFASVQTPHPQLVRFGVYGEPVLLPLYVVEKLSGIPLAYTGYTHQWTQPEYDGYKDFLMASTHNQFEVAIANSMGWRVFNVGLVDDAVNCPASKEGGKKTTCSSCALCGGVLGKSEKNIYILQH